MFNAMKIQDGNIVDTTGFDIMASRFVLFDNESGIGEKKQDERAIDARKKRLTDFCGFTPF